LSKIVKSLDENYTKKSILPNNKHKRTFSMEELMIKYPPSPKGKNDIQEEYNPMNKKMSLLYEKSPYMQWNCQENKEYFDFINQTMNRRKLSVK